MMGDPSKASFKGSIKIYGENPLEFQNNVRKKFSEFSYAAPSRSQSRTSTHLSHITSMGSSLGQTQHIDDWINEKSLRRIQKNHSIESLESRHLYMTVLRNEENLVHGIEEFLKETELLNLRRKELLYKDWHENVYEPTRRRVQYAIDARYPLLDQRKRAEYVKYLDYKNKKGDVFLDVMSKEEYDPMCLLRRSSLTNLKVKTERLRDPLLVQERQRIDEERLISRCETGDILSDDEIRSKWLPPLPLRPLGRHGTTCNTWLEMPLKYIDSPIHNRGRRSVKGSCSVTSIKFNDFETDCKDKNAKNMSLPPIETALVESTNLAVYEDDSPEDKKRIDFSLPPSHEDSELQKQEDEMPLRETQQEAETED